MFEHNLDTKMRPRSQGEMVGQNIAGNDIWKTERNRQRLELAARFVEARIRSTGHCEVSFTDHAVRLADALVKAAQE